MSSLATYLLMCLVDPGINLIEIFQLKEYYDAKVIPWTKSQIYFSFKHNILQTDVFCRQHSTCLTLG